MPLILAFILQLREQYILALPCGRSNTVSHTLQVTFLSNVIDAAEQSCEQYF